ncbi:hypothetical protein T08_4586, partial [Trichinella sp. T8]
LRRFKLIVLSLSFLSNITVSQNLKCSGNGAGNEEWVILYKGPTHANGKVLLSTAPGNWAEGAAPLANQAGHSLAGSLTGVVANAQDITFLAYNNVPPAVPNVQTKSNSKGRKFKNSQNI